MTILLSVGCVPSASNEFLLTARASGVPGDCNLLVSLGIASSAPAIYSDISSPHNRSLVFAGQYSIVKDQSGVQFSLSTTVQPFGTVGDIVWAALFANAPSAGSPVLAVSGPFAIER